LPASDLPELQRLAFTVSTWCLEVLTFIDTGVTNAGPAGTNRVIKTVAHDAYGFLNRVCQRLRSRCATTLKGRGSSIPV